ncbi:hypothetical protein HELRODRAFT_67484 [Helobdella robusta]|uniref:Nuclear receptor domain-containing protein n=1 Tax=Helobdella robusta TaxID=6412 RepID=T1FZ14_HELRO|nr:hypothetical protein HELRODRAFT_67484 [Helobdella robusta]ESN98806.1 hypothetical protein HELRODRAFT_67484 [Helobdella robusta]
MSTQEEEQPDFPTANFEENPSNEATTRTQSSLCDVCADVSSGFYCGAFVCEACKKFFVRCLQMKEKFRAVCTKDGKCVINKTTRTQCSKCRYEKCISLNMYGPGGRKVSEDINCIPCKVCGAPSSGFHFGVTTCEGCKGFYRRCVKKYDTAKFHCTNDNNCDVTWKTRNVCKFCRYQKCQDVGMMPESWFQSTILYL